MLKRLLKTDSAQRLIAWLAAQYIRAVYATSRWTVIGAEHPHRLQAEGKPLILCFWHGRLLMMPKVWTYPAPMNMLISNHSDGRLIARTIRHFGIRTIWGSSTRGGTAALIAMTRALGEGGCAGITPDGPRGPRMRAAPGVAMVARLSGAPVVPVTYSMSRAAILRSWDRFMLPLPFSRGVFIWGEPIEVPHKAKQPEMEAARAAIEAQLNRITHKADEICRRVPVEPAAVRRQAADSA